MNSAVAIDGMSGMGSIPDQGGGEDSFCYTPLWDMNLTWYTENPDFTPCFHQSVLAYIPGLVLLLGTPFQVYMSYQSRNRQVPWTFLNILKLFFNIGLIILPIVDLIYSYRELAMGKNIQQVMLFCV